MEILLHLRPSRVLLIRCKGGDENARLLLQQQPEAPCIAQALLQRLRHLLRALRRAMAGDHEEDPRLPTPPQNQKSAIVIGKTNERESRNMKFEDLHPVSEGKIDYVDEQSCPRRGSRMGATG